MLGKDFSITPYALARLTERGFDMDDLRQALRQEGFITAEYNGRYAFNTGVEKDGKMQLLRVIFDPGFDPHKIITVYVTSKLDKYRRRT